MNNMKLKYQKEKLIEIRNVITSISIGTGAGLITYALFLYLNIAIFGWNLGLVVAPLVAGYAETFIAKKIVGESIGAISAFILFIVTVVYGFILKNPTLGLNAITVGSILIITQAAIPTFINYFLIVVVLGVLSYFLGIFKKITSFIYYPIKWIYYTYIKKEPLIINVEHTNTYDDYKNNAKINNLGILFLSVTDPNYKTIKKYLGPFEEITLVPKEKKIISNLKEEKKQLNKLKEGKDKALYNLSNSVKNAGGNGVLNLVIEYDLVGTGKENYQISVRGTGVIFNT